MSEEANFIKLTGCFGTENVIINKNKILYIEYDSAIRDGYPSSTPESMWVILEGYTKVKVIAKPSDFVEYK
jgi:hypothetical protein